MLETAERNATSPAVKSDMAPATTPRLMDRVRDRIRVMHYAYSTLFIDTDAAHVYSAANAATTAGGLGGPDSEVDDRLQAVFLRPSHGKPQWAGRAGSLRARRHSDRSANLHGSAHPSLAGGKRDKKSLSEERYHA